MGDIARRAGFYISRDGNRAFVEFAGGRVEFIGSRLPLRTQLCIGAAAIGQTSAQTAVGYKMTENAVRNRFSRAREKMQVRTSAALLTRCVIEGEARIARYAVPNGLALSYVDRRFSQLLALDVPCAVIGSRLNLPTGERALLQYAQDVAGSIGLPSREEVLTTLALMNGWLHGAPNLSMDPSRFNERVEGELCNFMRTHVTPGGHYAPHDITWVCPQAPPGVPVCQTPHGHVE